MSTQSISPPTSEMTRHLTELAVRSGRLQLQLDMPVVVNGQRGLVRELWPYRQRGTCLVSWYPSGILEEVPLAVVVPDAASDDLTRFLVLAVGHQTANELLVRNLMELMTGDLDEAVARQYHRRDL